MISNQAPVRADRDGTAPPGGGSLGSRIRGMNVSVLREVALLPVLILLIVVLSFMTDGLLSSSNLINVLSQSAVVAIAAIGGNDAIVIFGFCLASGGVFSGLATFWTVPPLFLGGTAAAGAFALINSVGNLSGYFGPAMMGWLRQVTGDYKAGLWACVAVPIIAALSMALLSKSLVSKSPAREP